MDKKALQFKKADDALIAQQLLSSIEALKKTDWTLQSIEAVLRSLQEKNDWNKGQYFMLLRIVVTGKTATPPLFETIEVLGKEKTFQRLEKARSLFA